MIIVNNNFMRTGNSNNRNNNNNRNRNNNNNNRNRKFSSGGGSGSNSGGNSANKVFDSNGPDVKVRGTAQTVAEKYMQLGRDAQSSGDNVAAETYYQHAEHYYRLWAANQPVGQSLVMSKKFGEEEFQDEEGGGQDDQSEDDGQEPPQAQADAVQSENVEGQDAPVEQPREQRPRNDRNNNNRDNNGNRERFRPRWQNRRDGQPQDGQPSDAPQNVVEQQVVTAPVVEQVAEGQWEAPSFLQRPTPVVAEAVMAAPEVQERKPRTRRPRAEVVDAPAVEPAPSDE
jgi:hypothetical protein